jgi:hypothetical protein
MPTAEAIKAPIKSKRIRRANKHANKPGYHHLDKRAAQLIESTNGDDDELLSTRQLAELWGVSEQFLELARKGGYGPEWVRLAPRCIRYRRGTARAWLATRRGVQS